MTIEFNCPHCAKLLKTADDKAGVSARCPGCGQTIMVPLSSEEGAAAPAGFDDPIRPPPPPVRRDSGFAEEEVVDDVEPAAAETTLASGSGMKKCPMCGAQIKSAARVCKYCGEELPGAEGRRDRSFHAPHRGGLILALGILSWVVCPILSIIAWVMGNQDLKEMDAGRMDPEGRGLTQAGKIIGIVHICFIGFFICVYSVIIALVIVGANH